MLGYAIPDKSRRLLSERIVHNVGRVGGDCVSVTLIVETYTRHGDKNAMIVKVKFLLLYLLVSLIHWTGWSVTTSIMDDRKFESTGPRSKALEEGTMTEKWEIKYVRPFLF